MYKNIVQKEMNKFNILVQSEKLLKIKQCYCFFVVKV